MHCKVCRVKTDSRPYCSQHIDRLPYVQLLKQYVRNRDNEISDRAINLQGVITQEILESLTLHTMLTANKIGCLLDIPTLVVNRYVHAMIRAGYILEVNLEGEHMAVQLTREGQLHHHALKCSK